MELNTYRRKALVDGLFLSVGDLFTEMEDAGCLSGYLHHTIALLKELGIEISQDEIAQTLDFPTESPTVYAFIGAALGATAETWEKALNFWFAWLNQEMDGTDADLERLVALSMQCGQIVRVSRIACNLDIELFDQHDRRVGVAIAHGILAIVRRDGVDPIRVIKYVERFGWTTDEVNEVAKSLDFKMEPMAHLLGFASGTTEA